MADPPTVLLLHGERVLEVFWESEELNFYSTLRGVYFTENRFQKTAMYYDPRFCAVSPFCDSTHPSDPGNNHQ